MAGEYKDLEERLDSLLESTEDIRSQIKHENDKRDAQSHNNEMRMRTNRFTARVAIFVAVVGLLIGYVGVHTGHDAARDARVAKAANVQTNKILADTRKGSCEAQVVSAVQYRKGQKSQIRVLATAVISSQPMPITPAAQQRVNQFYMVYDKTVDANNPLRDCTDRGIACFLKIPPPADSKPCGDYDGYLSI